MRVPLEWLKTIVDFSLSPEEISARLTMAGLEVEQVEDIDGDSVFEINVTPNRPDCLSILGIAREVSALLNIPLKFPEHEIRDSIQESKMKVEIPDKALCPRYSGRVIRELTIADSPDWIKKRLEKCKVRSINNVVDITNYVLLEMGHPLHAFDMDKLEGMTIKIGQAAPGAKITTIDGVARVLPEDVLVIEDASGPIAVAGIMGGIETEVSDATKSIFLESAYFLPSSIRKTSKKLGLKTESSYRFERGTDIELLEKALDRAAFLIAQIAGGKVSKKMDVYPDLFKATEIKVRYKKINMVIGTEISEKEVLNIVNSLGIKTENARELFVAVPPSYRTDLQKEIDIIEEIARCYGYDRIPVTVPKISLAKETNYKRYVINDFFKGAGFTEVINYSFMNETMLEILKLPDKDPRRRLITLKNPINTEEAHLRTFITPSLIQNLGYNLSRGNRDLRLFEVSRVFKNNGETLPEEKHHIGAIYFSDKTKSLWKDETPDFYILKGVVESLMAEIRITDYSFKISEEPFLHPGKSCDLLVSGKKAGFIGSLHPEVIDKLSLKISRNEILVLEIDLDSLLLSVPEKPRYIPNPRFPGIERDIAVIVDDSVPAADLIEIIKAYKSALIRDVSIFDFYKGKNIPENKKSIAVSIKYMAEDRTLTDSEIENIHGRLTAFIIENTNGAIRGI